MKTKTLILALIIICSLDVRAFEVEITQPADGEVFETFQVYLNSSAKGGHPPYLFYWESSLDGVLDNVGMTTSEYDIYKFPTIGEHLITVKVVDSTGKIARDSIRITVKEPKLEAGIISPTEGVYSGYIEFSSRISGTPPYNVKWTSDKDGVFGTSENLSARLSPGDHLITLKVVDYVALIVYETVNIKVKSKPNVVIISPEPGRNDKNVEFNANISGGAPPYEIKWSSDVDGILGDAEYFVKELSDGEHTITLEVVDMEGISSSETRAIMVMPDLVAKIIAPTEGNYRGKISFNADISGGTPPYEVTWMSSREGFLGNEPQIARELSDGEHTISLRVMDDDLIIAEDTVTINILRSDYFGEAALFLFAAALLFIYFRVRRTRSE